MATEHTDILIVGAGMAGAATAYHLAHLADRRVIIAEKESLPGEHSSGRNAAFVRGYAGDESLQPLSTAGAAFLRQAILAEYKPCGSVLLGLGDADVSRYFPPARGRGRWCPDDGTVDTAALLQTYLAGRDVRCNMEITGFGSEGRRLIIKTNRETLTCDVLVNAAGPWAGRLGGLPLTPMKRHLFQTTPIETVDPAWPFIWDMDHGLYFRPESGGLLLSACDETPADPGDYAEDPEVLEDLARKLADHQPALSNVSIQSSWAGQRTFAPDRRFVIGFDPRNPKLFHVAALGGHGVAASWAIGRLAANLLLGKPDDLAAAFAPGRFG